MIPLFRDEGGRYVTLVTVDLTKTIVYRLCRGLASEACMFFFNYHFNSGDLVDKLIEKE